MEGHLGGDGAWLKFEGYIEDVNLNYAGVGLSNLDMFDGSFSICCDPLNENRSGIELIIESFGKTVYSKKWGCGRYRTERDRPFVWVTLKEWSGFSFLPAETLLWVKSKYKTKDIHIKGIPIKLQYGPRVALELTVRDLNLDPAKLELYGSINPYLKGYLHASITRDIGIAEATAGITGNLMILNTSFPH